MLPILSNLLVEAQGVDFTATDLERGIPGSQFSFLLIILMLWSISVLIYGILFFPELKQFVRARFGSMLVLSLPRTYSPGQKA
jgi:hypothetical protein